MDSHQNLQHQPSDLSAASGISLTASQQMLAVQIHLCSLNSKTDMEPELAAEFARVFSSQLPESLAYAFACWREISRFMPAISDIHALLKDWYRNKAELVWPSCGECINGWKMIDGRAVRCKNTHPRSQAAKEELEAARSRGELMDFATLMSDLAHLAQVPTPPTAQRQRFKHAMERVRRAEAPPGIILTPAQLMELAHPTTPEGIARLEREREQTRREVSASRA
jgi:hypothetical protein